MNGAPEHPGVEEGATEFLFDVETYLAMDKAGLFEGRRRTRLIEGKIYEMAPISPGHGRGQLQAVIALHELIARLGRRGEIGPVNATLVSGRRSAPEPDVIIAPLRESETMYVAADALLVCEVAWSSLRDDLGVMRTLYAAADVPEYWVMEARGRRLHVFRNPQGGDYGEAMVLQAGDRVSPLFAEGRGDIAVADLL